MKRAKCPYCEKMVDRIGDFRLRLHTNKDATGTCQGSGQKMIPIGPTGLQLTTEEIFRTLAEVSTADNLPELERIKGLVAILADAYCDLANIEKGATR